MEVIKGLDTVYILFKKNDVARYKNVKFRYGGNQFVDEYFLTGSNGKRIHITAPNDKNTDEKKYTLAVKRKKFLAQNKQKIIDMEFIDKHGLGEVFIGLLEVQWGKKKVYIITDEELKRRKIVLQKAIFEYSDFIIM